MKKEAKTAVNQITEGVIWKQLLLFFFPIVFGTFFQQIYNTADTIVVGRFVGKQALAAVGGSTTVIVNLAVGLFVGLSSGASVILAQFYGAKDDDSLEKTLHTAFAFSIIGSIVLGVIGYAGSRWMLQIMDTPADVLEDSVLYLHIYFIGMLFNLLYNMGAGILRAVGDPKRPLYVLIITCTVNIILDLLLVIGFGLGVLGVAAATVISQAISAVIVIVMLLKTKESYRLIPSRIRFHSRYLKAILRIGIPAALESTMYNVSNLIIQVYVNKLGTDIVAAWGTLSKIDAFFWMVLNAFGISITTFVGQNYGAGKFTRMKKSVRICMIMALFSSVAISGTIILFGKELFGLFTSDQKVLQIGVHMIFRMLPAYSIFVVISILSGALRGAGKVLIPMVLTCGGVCTLKLLWLFTMVPRYPGIDTIMLSYPISWSITATLFVIYYLKRFPKSYPEAGQNA